MTNPLAERARSHSAREQGAIAPSRAAAVRVALLYPNTYFVGMSSLAVHTLYHLLNSAPGITCERVFTPDRGCERDPNLPLVTIETQTPLDRFDVIAVSLSYELDYINVVDALRRARLPVFARDRGARYPLVIAGGVCAGFNPEPLADIVDVFVVGEVEPVIERLTAVFTDARGRADALRRFRELPGVYVPSAYAPRYSSSGDFEALVARDAPKRIPRLQAKDLDRWPTHSHICTPDTEFGGMFLLEISRGCAHACKFCVTSPCYAPYRYRSEENLLATAGAGLQHHRAVGLVAAAVSDHPQIDRLVRDLRQLKARISMSSLRADSASTAMVEALAESGARSITLAPEAGTERLRRRLRKFITDEQYLAAARLAHANGIRRLRLYFMLGLPGETDADVEAIPRLVHRLKREARMSEVTASVSFFVPKPGTAFEREPMAPVAAVAQRLKSLRANLRVEPAVTLSAEAPNWAYIQAALARGDRRLGAVIARAHEAGGALAAWRAAFADEGLDANYFAGRRREATEPLPWSHIG